MIDIEGIMSILPHRYPFLLVDRIVEMEPGSRIVGIKNVTLNEPFFQGHFPGKPVMPGVLMIEAMAQVGAVLLLKDIEDRDEKLALFAGIDEARFRRPVVPGDQIRFELEVLRKKATTAKLHGKATVDGEMACEATVMCALVDRKK
ncbi:MAG TPA: 3-hydroxyacyl-ACP dehydratase FabZ [Acidobacteriota bacterium]|nr:3-hydroxyacyl-ACP dehydratase FabZ [Acidobacteriota bacterium]HNT16984.1 3-hydroxyacyl-ACP dehydratase FabZ [Acidobacteriota bacterium]HPA26774.1 3-hydroxyacyl-ACP dehydratase FabZ [Acidobacteriota bacterium]HQO20606.1 3-hydroxyacyl-ACP dehydratase FabZ [Acidobacteriota bacterium]HQQ47455.1 3-hydroxyacyl-ACP dehydratase FabZ [Acidobacteriota bacterium]